jgi:hypothetical protein
MPTIPPNTSNKNFQIAILFNVAEISIISVFEEGNAPPLDLRARVVSYTLGLH